MVQLQGTGQHKLKLCIVSIFLSFRRTSNQCAKIGLDFVLGTILKIVILSLKLESVMIIYKGYKSGVIGVMILYYKQKSCLLRSC